MRMSEVIENRSEILFIYDVTDANPNGDPLNEDRPRMDEETGHNIVTDVRLKRTIRDYLNDYLGENIFIKEEKTAEGIQKTRARRLGEFLCNNSDRFEDWDIDADELKDMNDSKIQSAIGDKVSVPELAEALLETYTDLRLFGATIAVENSTITRIGPVQLKFGRSLHEVEPTFVKGTTVMPSREDVTAGTMTEMHILPYSLLQFYGVINENAAKHTGLGEEDIELLMDGLWNGTKNLITRSKFGQVPRFLLRVEYKENNYHIGDLDKGVEFKSDTPDKQIRRVQEGVLDITQLMTRLKNHLDKIGKIEILADSDTTFVLEDEEYTGDALGDAFPKDVEVVPIDVGH
jgi:CRISPR-associated protein Csh2